ncbi:MAG: hypothetical protein K9K79_04915 [Desulfohalobiaceae bacterium]|nr:hypothetical protein [Desulfohalobiaceae bacterium]
MTDVAEKVSYLEDVMQRLASSQLQANISLDRLSFEMREFKDEMREFKDEMREFKDEMREFKDEMREFKDEMREYKDWSKKQIVTMNRQWGDLANKLGTVVEDIVAPNLPRIAREYFGCEDVDYLAIRVKKRSVTDRSKRREFDAIAVCDKTFVLNETKSSPEFRDVEKLAAFLESDELFDYFPEYRDYRVCPIYSSLYLDEAFVSALTKKGIYALAMKDDTMEILNYSDVK